MNKQINTSRLQVSAVIEEAFNVERLPFRRTMTCEELDKLQGVISLAFSRDIDAKLLDLIANYCFYIERHMQGRASGSIEDLVIRYLMRYLSSIDMEEKPEDLYHLEIGVLFGATTILSSHAVKLAGTGTGIIVIDPFEGYYDKEIDPFTKLPVTEERFRSNLERFGFNQEKIRIYKGLSTDSTILEKCSHHKLLSLIIDGDHSYEGVKRDWLNYSGLVIEGGYVLIDDYNCKYWPEVTQFVNREILSYLADKWEPVIIFGNTIILKKLGNGKDEENRLARLVHELKDRERKIELQAREIEDKNREMQAVLNSISWKITKPLRWLRDRYRKT